MQAKFEDALYGRAEQYLEWLDFVEAPAGGGSDVPTGVDGPSKVSS